MIKLKIEIKIRPADRFLQNYQVCNIPYGPWYGAKITDHFTGHGYFQNDKANDFEVVCRDGKFGVHLYCLINSDFLYKQYEARMNFDGEGKGFW